MHFLIINYLQSFNKKTERREFQHRGPGCCKMARSCPILLLLFLSSSLIALAQSDSTNFTTTITGESISFVIYRLSELKSGQAEKQ